jgi:PAS domain S-box-containing protein
VKSKAKILAHKPTDALDNLPVAVIIFDNKQIYYINNLGQQILGNKKPVDILQLKISVFDLLLPEYRKSIKENNEKILKGKPHQRLEFKIKNLKGKVLHFESNSNRTEYNGKKVIQTTLQEITARKSQEKELFKTEELFNLLNTHSNDIIFKFDFFPKPKCAFISDSFGDVFGFSKKDFLSDPKFYEKIIHPEDKKDYIFTLEDFQRFLKSKKTSTTLRYQNKRKQTVWLETIYTPIKDQKGKIVSMLGISRDVSHQTKTEVALSEKQEQFDIISNNAHDILYFFSYVPKPHYLYISPSVEKVLGYKTEQFYKDPFFINKKTIGSNNELKKHEKQAISSQKNNTLKQKKVLYKMLGKDGREMWMEDHILPIKDEKGKIKFVFGIVRNITELKAQEEEIKEKWSNYHTMLDQSPFAFFIHRNGFCELCNKEAARILGFSAPEKIYGKYLIDFIVPEQREKAISRLKAALNGKELDFFPYQINSVKNKKVSIELKSMPIVFSGNKCMLTIMQDVTNKEIYAKEKLRAELAEEHNKNLIEEIALRKKIEEKLIVNEKQVINQAAKLSAIFESSSHLVWTVNSKFELTYFNQNYYNTFKTKYGIEPEIGKMPFDYIPKQFKDENKAIWHPLYRRVLTGEQVVFERPDRDSKGGDVYREVFLSPIRNEKGQVFEIACLAHDITENKRYEKENIAQASKIKAIFESGTHIMWTVNKNMAYTSFNKNFSDAIYDLYAKRPEVNKELNRPENQYSSTEYHSFWNGKYEEAFAGKEIEFITERTNTSGQKVFRQIYLHPIYNNKEVVEVSGMGIDITDKITSEQKIVNQAAKLNAVFDGSSHYIWTVNAENQLTSFNKNFIDLLSRAYNAEPKEGMRINAVPFVSDEDYNAWWEGQFERAFGGERLNFETSFTDGDNNKIYLDVFLNPIYHDNKIIEVSGIAHDITERVHHEEKVHQSLKEKEVLLKEVHHRVKNNMQVISSILNLQSSYVTDQYALNLLKESQNRIKTMAYIHESLYQNKTFTSINFSEYISTLTNNILQSYAASIQKVKLELDIQKIILNLDTSIPAGLIINELVTNSIKHAFSGSNEGIILINLYTKDNTLFLEVSDNGKGFPKDVDFKNTNSLGLQLVNTLVEQLNGKLELNDNKEGGTSFFINFPM